jgi:GGDEF domain-containing protein
MNEAASRQTAHDRSYLQARIREEINRAERYGRSFALLIFESSPGTDGLPPTRKAELGLRTLASAVRPSDVVARVYDDTIVVLLVEATAQNAKDAFFRMRARMAAAAGSWRVTLYAYPTHAESIRALPLLNAA